MIFPFNAGGRHFLLPALRLSRKSGNMSNQSYTVDEFCKAERMSRSMLYKIWSQGKGPRFYLCRHRPAHLRRSCARVAA